VRSPASASMRAWCSSSTGLSQGPGTGANPVARFAGRLTTGARTNDGRAHRAHDAPRRRGAAATPRRVTPRRSQRSRSRTGSDSKSDLAGCEPLAACRPRRSNRPLLWANSKAACLRCRSLRVRIPGGAFSYKPSWGSPESPPPCHGGDRGCESRRRRRAPLGKQQSRLSQNQESPGANPGGSIAEWSSQ
jgi:hypothetical protein